MKLFSISAISNLLPGQPVKAEVVASHGGKNLVMVNGRPVQMDASVDHQSSLKALSGPVSVAANATAQISPEQILAQAGLEKNDSNLQLIETMRQHGVPLTPENAGKAAAIAASMPSFDMSRAALSSVVLVMLRRLPADSAELIHDYLSGRLRYAHLFGENKQLGEVLRLNASFADVLKQFQQMLGERSRAALSFTEAETKSFKGLAENLLLQELLSETAHDNQENRIYFQWPLFWANAELPDTLEGEAFFTKDREQGFCLRLLVSPPALGQIEVAMNQLDQALWMHFGVDEAVIEDIRAIFPLLTAKLENEGFPQVRLTVGKLRHIDNFLLEPVVGPEAPFPAAKLDLRV